MKTAELRIDEIRIDGGTQSRVAIDEEAVASYAEALTESVALPAITVFHDGAAYWLGDGFHRFHAAKRIGAVTIDCEVISGTVRDAKLYAAGANAQHGLRRSREDKRNAVSMLLQDDEWRAWSDREIARRCNVAHTFVSKLRDSLTGNVASENVTKRNYITKHGTESSMDVSGQKQHAKEVRSPSTTEPKLSDAGISKDLSSRDQKLASVPEDEFEADDELSEARYTIADLSDQVDELRAKLAVENMDASESAKAEASEIIADLRAQIKTRDAELSAMRIMRDRLQAENAELKRQISMNAKELKKYRGAA